MKVKYIIILIVLASIAAIVYGFNLKEENLNAAHKFIGFGTAGLFLIAMPLFLLKESKGKKVEDYMLTKENLRKMQGKDSENSENQ